MREIKRSSKFKRDYKRVKSTPKHHDINIVLIDVINCLVEDADLPEKNRDHSLIGDFSGYRECHLKPDLLLIYFKEGDDILKLYRIGSHSEIF